MSRHFSWLVVLGLFAGVAALACSDGDSTVAGPPAFRTETIVVSDGGLEPSEVDIRVPDTVRIVVDNRSSDPCSFDLGDYLKNLEVAPGKTEAMELTAFEVDAASPERVPMGCRGDATRSGTVRILTSTAR